LQSGRTKGSSESGAAGFALFGGDPLFRDPKPTGNLYRPEIETFLRYSRQLFANKWYTDGGELCRLLEERLARFHDVEHVIAVNSGFWGHVLAFRALALAGRREIIAPSFGYRRTDDMIAWAGFTPHFCDVDAQTLCPSVETIQAEINEDTALILAPHPMVNCCDAQGIEALGQNLGMPVVFDSVEAGYRAYNSRRIGGFGDAEVFSMHATKLLNAFEGGYLTTNSGDLASRLVELKSFGLSATGTVRDGMALNAKFNEVHAAMALASLDEVEEQVAQHRRKYELYRAGLRGIDGLELIEHKTSERPDYRPIVARLTDVWPLSREETLLLLEAERVLARPYYAPLHHKLVDYHRICPELPVTEAIFRRFLVLPSGSHVAPEDVKKIVELLARIRRGSRGLMAGWKTA
jgi:dTDP-4-amino-4,6-dideoxygalactose transaminase